MLNPADSFKKTTTKTAPATVHSPNMKKTPCAPRDAMIALRVIDYKKTIETKAKTTMPLAASTVTSELYIQIRGAWEHWYIMANTHIRMKKVYLAQTAS